MTTMNVSVIQGSVTVKEERTTTSATTDTATPESVEVCPMLTCIWCSERYQLVFDEMISDTHAIFKCPNCASLHIKKV